MKLIDLLLQELPKRGGWPIGSSVLSIHNLIENHQCSYGRDAYGTRYFESDETGEIVTQKQYEAALAESQQPGWSGEGLPPAGSLVELMDDSQSQTWGEVTIKFYGDAFAVWDDHGNEESNSLCHVKVRPIRTEEDRKRDEAIKFMIDVFRDHVDNRKSNGQNSVFHAIYEAFKAGKFE